MISVTKETNTTHPLLVFYYPSLSITTRWNKISSFLTFFKCNVQPLTSGIVVYGYGQSRIWGGGATGSHVAGSDVSHPKWHWPEVTSSNVTWHLWVPLEGWVRACATGSCAISALVGPRKWRQSGDRKRPCPEVCACATGSCATVSRGFFFWF